MFVHIHTYAYTHVRLYIIYVLLYIYACEKYENVTSQKEMRCANERGNLIYVAVKLKGPLGMNPATCT